MSGQLVKRIIFFLSLSQLFIAAVHGQSPPTANNVWGAKSNADRNQNIRPLADAPDLPQMPSYSGKLKFLRGYTQSAGKGWVAYHVSCLTQEDPARVKSWYENALGMYQWKILSSAGQTLTANHKDGHMCTLIFNPSTKPGFRTRLGMFYSQAPQTPAGQE